MMNLIMDQELDLGRAKRGLRVRRICSRLQRQKNLRITEVQEDLITGKISLQQFLKMFNNEHKHQQYSMQKLINEGIILFICDILAALFYIYIKKSTDKTN